MQRPFLPREQLTFTEGRDRPHPLKHRAGAQSLLFSKQRADQMSQYTKKEGAGGGGLGKMSGERDAA